MATDGGNTNDPTARRRRIAEKGSDRLALITGRAQNIPSPPSPTSAAQSHHSYAASCPPSLTRLSDQFLPCDENRDPLKAETAGNDAGSKVQPVLRKSETTRIEASKHSAFEPKESQSSPNKSAYQSTLKKAPKSDLKTYLCKTFSPHQLRPAIIAAQDIRRKCSLVAAIIALLSYVGFPILGSYIIRSIILSRPLLLLLLINMTITLAPLLLDAVKMIEQGGNACSSTGDADFSDHLGLAFEWGILLKTSLSAFFMDSSIYSVMVVCGMSFLQKFGL